MEILLNGAPKPKDSLKKHINQSICKQIWGLKSQDIRGMIFVGSQWQGWANFQIP